MKNRIKNNTKNRIIFIFLVFCFFSLNSLNAASVEQVQKLVEEMNHKLQKILVTTQEVAQVVKPLPPEELAEFRKNIQDLF